MMRGSELLIIKTKKHGEGGFFVRLACGLQSRFINSLSAWRVRVRVGVGVGVAPSSPAIKTISIILMLFL